MRALAQRAKIRRSCRRFALLLCYGFPASRHALSELNSDNPHGAPLA